MLKRVLFDLLNPNDVTTIEPNVVRPPLGTELRNALTPANQNCPTLVCNFFPDEEGYG